MSVLEVRELVKSYVSPDGERSTVIDVPAFSMHGGEHVALQGASGSGKTTFLHLIAGILQADRGRIHIDGREMTALAEAGRDRLRAEAAEAKRELDRAEELYSRTVSSTTELDSAKLRHTRAQSALTVAEARATIAKKNLADAELKAPFNGVVAAVPAAPGVVVASDCQPRALVVMRR